jgi:hypothetical protein
LLRGGQKDDYGSFGWVIGTKSYGTAKVPREAHQCSPTEPKDTVVSLLLFLTHYIRYHNIETADDLRVTSYCDNSSLLKAEEEFHTRDVDSSSWY